jgi:hypothetical protein
MPEGARRAFDARAIPLAEAAGCEINEADAAARWAQHWAAWWEEEMITQIIKSDYADNAKTKERFSALRR